MRIMIITPSLTHGGAERVASIWANNFQKEGHEVIVATNTFETLSYKINDGIMVLPIFSSLTFKRLKYLTALKNIRKHIKKEKPHVVIGVMWIPSLLGFVSSIGLHIPIVMTEHNSFERPKCAPLSTMDRIAKFFFNYFYDGITVLTTADIEIIKNRFKKVFVLPNPLSLEPLSILPQKENILLAAGRLDAWHYKGFDLLIRAWGLINGENAAMQREKCKSDDATCKIKDEGWRLKIAGTGSEENVQYLKQLCKENGVEDSVEFVGFVSDMQSLYQKASIFVLSSRYEAFGMVLIEAMSQGCACVACDYKGRQKEIIRDSSEGIICETENVDALADAISTVMYNKEYQLLLQRNAIERSKCFLPNTIIKKWDSILTTVVK